jgi:pimeloyl-ACP methyl ester carboxylesterase
VAELERHRVDANGVGLNVYALGEGRGRPPVVVLHGMRDVALSLLPVAEALARDYRVLLPDLRGHGASDRPGSYAMHAFLADLHCLLEHFELAGTALVGHSLGGQLVARFAALFPERVAAAVIVEGLGPPQRPQPADPAAALRMEGQRLLATTSARARALPSLEFAAERLLVNNPRITEAQALALARQATETAADGERYWSFDPTVGTVFLNVGPGDSERYWPAVRCPTLLISGDHAGEYWSAATPAASEWSGDFAPGELEARINEFPDHEHEAFEGSGHMVHFDEPERLATTTLEFLRRRYG